MFAAAAETRRAALWHTTRTVRAARRDLIRRLCVCALAVTTIAPHADAAETPLLRVFLNDGTTIACYGEYARAGGRIVMSVPLGQDEDGRPRLQLVSLPEDQIDWARTERYRDASRAAQYAATRGEQDFTAMTAEVARTLNAIAATPDPARQLDLAEQARRQLATWGRDHYGYRAREVAEIAALLDETISELRAAAGHQAFDLTLVAVAEPPPAESLLGPPSAADVIAQSVALAERADDPAERQALYAGTLALIDASRGRLDAAALRTARRHVVRQLERERSIDEQYRRLTQEVTGLARDRAARADVRGVQSVLELLGRRDVRLGRQRPQMVAGARAVVRQQIDSARRLRLARDHWAVKVRAYRAYEQLVRRPVGALDVAHEPLEDIRRLAGPEPQSLRGVGRRIDLATRRLEAIVPPSGMAQVHDLLRSACRLAATAVSVREEAVALGSLERAWSASAAAAGAQLLLARAREELKRLLAPPQLR